MRFYTREECEQWLQVRNRSRLVRTDEPAVRYPSTFSRMLYVSRWIATEVAFRQPVLLWVTECDVWDSNWHLYYKLRQSYHDLRLIHEAPGHYFLEHESEDIASFIQLVMLNGWDAHLLTHAGYINLFFSHDEFTDIYTKDQRLLELFTKSVGDTPSAPA